MLINTCRTKYLCTAVPNLINSSLSTAGYYQRWRIFQARWKRFPNQLQTLTKINTCAPAVLPTAASARLQYEVGTSARPSSSGVQLFNRTQDQQTRQPRHLLNPRPCRPSLSSPFCLRSPDRGLRETVRVFSPYMFSSVCQFTRHFHHLPPR